MKSTKSYQRYVFAISDATGKTCEIVINAALSQFKTTQIILKTISNVRTLEQIDEMSVELPELRESFVRLIQAGIEAQKA